MMLTLAGVLAAGAARADVVYSANVQGPGAYHVFGISLDLTNAQVASGSFSLRGGGSGPVPRAAGFTSASDVSGFSSLNFYGEAVRPNFVYGQITANLTFAADSITSISLDFLGVSSDVSIRGSGDDATVTFGSDDPCVCLNAPCTVTTAFTTTITPSNPVPEPAAFAVLGAGLLGMAGLRRQFSSGEA